MLKIAHKHPQVYWNHYPLLTEGLDLGLWILSLGCLLVRIVRTFLKPLIRIDYHHVNVLNNYIKQLYLICPAQSPLYVVSIPNNGSNIITKVHLDYFHITILIAKLLTALIV